MEQEEADTHISIFEIRRTGEWTDKERQYKFNVSIGCSRNKSWVIDSEIERRIPKERLIYYLIAYKRSMSMIGQTFLMKDFAGKY